MVIYVARHGMCTDNVRSILNGTRDSFLVDEGRLQFKKSAKSLKDKKIKVIYASLLSRAWETAVGFASELDVDLYVEPLLVERNFGILTGKPVSAISMYAKEIIKGDRVDYFLDTKGAETYDEVYSRAEMVLKKVSSKHVDENVLLVTHGAIGQILRASYYKLPWRECLEKMPYFENAEIIELNGKILKF